MYPLLFKSSFFTLYSYPFFMGLAWGFGYYFTEYLFSKNNLDTKQLKLLFISLFVSSFIGAKLFFLWFSGGNKIYQYIYANNFWLGGGFVFYGGLILGLITFFIYSLLLKKFKFSESYLLLPGLVFGHAIGRIGCLLAGCCFGSETELPWGVDIFSVRRHPVQLYESLFLLVLGMTILKLIFLKKSNLQIIGSYLVSYSVARFFLEFFRGDSIRGEFNNFLSSSQYISLCLIIVFFIAIIANKKAQILAYMGRIKK